jgi:Rrf2 family transcriptional regulator, nitric oxide-sensitive transcriptional repressor
VSPKVLKRIRHSPAQTDFGVSYRDSTMLSQTVEYALRATLYIARNHPRAVPVNDIAMEIDAPSGYLAKILSELARAGILESSRGPGGGFRIATHPNALALADVVRAIEGREERRCLLGHGRCGANPQCTAHTRWSPIATAMDAFFGNTTLADLLQTPMPH